MNLRNLLGRATTKMPDAVRRAFLQILYHTLVNIRSSKNAALIFALSDHAHNIPCLIEEYTTEAFYHYWEVERPNFIGAMKRLNEPSSVFEEHWIVLGQHFNALKKGPRWVKASPRSTR